MCCPIWRSMIYSYCQQQQQQQQQALPFNVIAPAAAPNLSLSQGQEMVPSGCVLSNERLLQSDQSNNNNNNNNSATSFSSTQLSTNQQQQHNTTIDLKIEIGADFKRLAAGKSPRSIRLRHTTTRAPAKPRGSSSDDTADSLDPDGLEEEEEEEYEDEDESNGQSEGHAYSEQTATSGTDESLQLTDTSSQSACGESGLKAAGVDQRLHEQARLNVLTGSS